MAAALHTLPAGLVWSGRQFARPAEAGLSSGFAALDAELPGGGWPRGSLIELLSDTPGIGELQLLLPMLKHAPAPQLNLWIAPPHLPYAPALTVAGIDAERLLVVRPATREAALWATRQALASGACHSVLAWLERPDMAALRRLQLAAESSGTSLFLFRPASAARQPSPAGLRLQLSAADARLCVHLLKRRGPAAAAPLLLRLQRPWNEQHAVDRPRLARAAAAGLHARHA